MINVDGVEYRNLEEQVQFLTDQYNGLDETFASKAIVDNIESVLNDQQSQITSANQQIANVNQQVQTIDGKFANYVPIVGTQTLDAKIFKTEIALQSPEGEITRLKNINNNITLTNGNGVNLLNIDEQLHIVQAFGKTLATLEDLAEGEGTKVTVGGVVQSTWNADSVVNTTGDQSISGIKTFNSNIVLANQNSILATLSSGSTTPILNISLYNNMTLGGNGIGYIASYNDLRPSGNNSKIISLGGNNAFWNDIYLSGNLKDDNSNSISIAQIANKSQITTEATERQQADTNLQNQIDSEESTRQSQFRVLETSINSEITARQQADTNLQNQIDPLSARDYVVAKGNNYIRWNNGLQICWGYFDNGSTSNDKTGINVTFDMPFVSTPTLICSSGKLDGTTSYRSTYCNYYTLSTTSATLGWYGSTASSCGWVAIGKYK